MEIVPEKARELNTSGINKIYETLFIKHIHCSCCAENNFSVFQKTTQEYENEIYSINYNDCGKTECLGYPISLRISKEDSVVGKMKLEYSNCCKRITRHKVVQYKSEKKVKVSDIEFILPGWIRDLTVVSSPFFQSRPTRIGILPMIIIISIVCMLIQCCNWMFSTSLWLFGCIIQSVLLVIMLIAIGLLTYRRGGCSREKTVCLLDLFDLEKGNLVATIYTIKGCCCYACCGRGDYEIAMFKKMDEAQIFTLLGITMKLHSMFVRNEG